MKAIFSLLLPECNGLIVWVSVFFKWSLVAFACRADKVLFVFLCRCQFAKNKCHQQFHIKLQDLNDYRFKTLMEYFAINKNRYDIHTQITVLQNYCSSKMLQPFKFLLSDTSIQTYTWKKYIVTAYAHHGFSPVLKSVSTQGTNTTFPSSMSAWARAKDCTKNNKVKVSARCIWNE